MKNLEKININNETIFLKKSFDGWHVVYPYKNEDGSFNWFNFLTGGNYWKLFYLIIILLVIVGFIYEYRINLLECTKIMESINNNLSTNNLLKINNFTLKV